MSIFLRPKWRKKWGHWRPMEAAWGHLRPFEAKVKLWVSKFIFFHADSGNGLKHNFEAVFEANLRLFCYLKAYLKGFHTTDWAQILRGWLFLRLGFHEHVFEAKSEKKMRSLEANGGIFFHADSGNGLKHNFEAVLSFKSLFEKVPEDLQGSDFVWRAKIKKKYSHFITSLEAIGVLFFTRGHLRLLCHLNACLN